MPVSDPVLLEAATGLASSVDYNANINDLEDTLLAGFGPGVLSGGTVSDAGGLLVNIEASVYLIGIKLSKSAENGFALLANSTNRIWAVTDPDDDERISYLAVAHANAVERAVKIAEAVTDGADILTLTNDLPDKWARPLARPLIPQQDVIAATETQVIHAGEQVQVFESLTIKGVLTIAGKVRVTA